MIARRPTRGMLDRAAVEAAETPQPCAVAQIPVPDEQQHSVAEELAKAARYVRALLPEPQTGLVDVDWDFTPSAELGGDAFGYHWLDDEHFAVYLLDASGHGFGAALHSVSVLNVLRAQALRDTDFHEPSEVLAALNEAFQMKRYNNMYVTIWYGVFNCRTRRLTYATGGHPPALLVTDPAGALRVERLRTRGLLIGGVRDVTYPSASVTISEGSALYLFSDGVYELRQADGTMMDLDDFEDLLVEQLARGAGEVHQLMERINALRDCRRCIDDSALLRITFN